MDASVIVKGFVMVGVLVALHCDELIRAWLEASRELV